MNHKKYQVRKGRQVSFGFKRVFALDGSGVFGAGHYGLDCTKYNKNRGEGGREGRREGGKEGGRLGLLAFGIWIEASSHGKGEHVFSAMWCL